MQSEQRKGERSEGIERYQKVERETASSIIIQNMTTSLDYSLFIGFLGKCTN